MRWVPTATRWEWFEDRPSRGGPTHGPLSFIECILVLSMNLSILADSITDRPQTTRPVCLFPYNPDGSRDTRVLNQTSYSKVRRVGQGGRSYPDRTYTSQVETYISVERRETPECKVSPPVCSFVILLSTYCIPVATVRHFSFCRPTPYLSFVDLIL